MVKQIENAFVITTLAILFALVNCVPTSVLVNSKSVVSADNNKGEKILLHFFIFYYCRQK